jgi:glycosyltransferase involved in cell wall biosynthesis
MVVFSSVEREQYHRMFNIPFERIEFIPWGVRPPEPVPLDHPVIDGNYICAIGGNARDYPTLLRAMSQLPKLRLVMVARPHNIEGLVIPPNVTVETNIAIGRAMNILRFSRFMVLPLTRPDVPCGHVTLVSAMHLGVPFVITRSTGVVDYVRHNDNALMCNPADPTDLAETISRLWADDVLRSRLGASSRSFAQTFCTEEATMSHLSRIIQSLGIRMN